MLGVDAGDDEAAAASASVMVGGATVRVAAARKPTTAPAAALKRAAIKVSLAFAEGGASIPPWTHYASPPPSILWLLSPKI